MFAVQEGIGGPVAVALGFPQYLPCELVLWVNPILAAQLWPASGLTAWTVGTNVVADTVDRRIACASITITSIVVFMHKQILKAVYK